MNSKNIITYESSGVNIEAGDKAVELMKADIKASLNENVFQAAGGFAGMFDLSKILKDIKNPVLTTSTDGVGTKVAIAQAIDKHDTIGYDLVGMVIDDIVVTGAKPLFMTDYICVGKVIPERIAEIVKGIANACVEADTALIAGETAEHPGLLGEDEYDVAGAATGIIDKANVLGADLVKDGDAIIALESSGLHSNGFSLVRKVFQTHGYGYDNVLPELRTQYLGENPSLGEALLVPTRIYTKVCLELADKLDIHAFSHITGGGIAANVARILPEGLNAVIERNSWVVPNIFQVVAEIGSVPLKDMEKTLNMGIGMVVILSKEEANRAIKIANDHKIKAWICGKVISDSEFDVDDDLVAKNTKGVKGGKAVIL